MAGYGETAKRFLAVLNREHGRYHAEAFTLTACLVYFPPIFVPEDLHTSDYELLDKYVRQGGRADKNKVWQVLKKLNEGNNAGW